MNGLSMMLWQFSRGPLKDFSPEQQCTKICKGRLTNQFFHANHCLDSCRVGGFAGGCFEKSVKIDYVKCRCFSQPLKAQMANKQAESNMYTY